MYLEQRFLVTAVVVAILSGVGCADYRGVKLTLHSDPPGAMIYEQGNYLGLAPLSQYWQVPGVEEPDSLVVGPYAARWSDGSVVEVPGLRIDVPAGYGEDDLETSPYANLLESYSNAVHAYTHTFIKSRRSNGMRPELQQNFAQPSPE